MANKNNQREAEIQMREGREVGLFHVLFAKGSEMVREAIVTLMRDGMNMDMRQIRNDMRRALKNLKNTEALEWFERHYPENQ